MELLDETNDLIDRRENTRPVFITVLCILTWVACGITLLSSFFQLITLSTMRQGVWTLNSHYYDLQFWAVVSGFSSTILCGIGAFLMFKLKKVGFFFYLAGQLIAMSHSLYSAFSVKIPGFGSGFFASIGLIALIFPIAFIVMYAIHYKHLK